MLKSITIFFITTFALGVGVVFCYDNVNTHPQLSRGAVQVYNNSTNVDKISDEQANWIEYGAINEDTDPRYLNHFYNPKTGQGLKDGFWSGVPAKKWAQKQTSMTGDYSYQTILNNYKDGNKKRAWQGVGHILHLIQDMTVPAHVRIDAHPEGDPYEAWAQQFGRVDIGKVSKSSTKDLNQVFDILASYSYDNFFSKDTISINNINSYKIIENIEGDKKIKYLSKNIDNKRTRLVLLDDSSFVPIYSIEKDKYLNQDYWNLLSPKAISYSAGVIELFVKEFKKIDDQKAAELAKMSLLQKLGNGVKDLAQPVVAFSDAAYVWGDAFMAVRPIAAPVVSFAVETVVGETKAILTAAKLTGSVVKTGGELVVDTSKTVGDKAVDAGRTVGDKVVVASGEVKGVFISAVEAKKPGEVVNMTVSVSAEAAARQSKIMTPVEVKVARVIDGDSIELVTGEKVRYIGVDAPELNGAGSADDECLAWAAKVRNEQLIQSGQVRLVSDAGADKDAYGRLLRYVYAGNTFVNGQLANEGLVKTFFCQAGWNNCPVMSDVTRNKIILDAANAAMAKKRGLYSGVCAKKVEVIKEPEIVLIKEDEPQPKLQEIAEGVQILFDSVPLYIRRDDDIESIVLDDGVSDEVVVVPDDFDFSGISLELSDPNTGDADFTASTIIRVNIAGATTSPLLQYYLSLDAADDDVVWSGERPEEFHFEGGTGPITVYLYLKYDDTISTTTVSDNIYLDLEAPQIHFLATPDGITSSSEATFDIAWHDVSREYISSNVVTLKYKLDDDDWVDIDDSSIISQFANRIVLSDLADGSHVFTVEATDRALNVTTLSDIWIAEVFPLPPPDDALPTVVVDDTTQADHVVISEILVGTASSTLEEFIELYNPTDNLIDLSSYRLSKKTESGTRYTLVSDFADFPDHTILPHSYYIVSKEIEICYNGVMQVYADATYTTATVSIANDNTIILYSDAGVTEVDKVGYGNASDFEGQPLINIPAGSSFERKYLQDSTYETMPAGHLGNGYDNDDNVNDFIIRIDPDPRGSFLLPPMPQ